MNAKEKAIRDQGDALENGKRIAIKLITSIFLVFIGFGIYAYRFPPASQITPTSAAIFAGLWGEAQLLGLWIIIETPQWRWPSKRWAVAATVFISLGIVTFSAGISWLLQAGG